FVLPCHYLLRDTARLLAELLNQLLDSLVFRFRTPQIDTRYLWIPMVHSTPCISPSPAKMRLRAHALPVARQWFSTRANWINCTNVWGGKIVKYSLRRILAKKRQAGRLGSAWRRLPFSSVRSTGSY